MLILSFFFSLSLQTQAAVFVINDKNLNAEEKIAAHALVEIVTQKLPPKMRDSLPKPISVSWGDLGQKYAGHAIGNKIILNKSYLPQILKGPEQSSTPEEFLNQKSLALRHPRMYQLAIASMIHEVAHIYDQQNIQSIEDKKMIERCSKRKRVSHKRPGTARAQALLQDCHLYTARRSTVSSNPNFLNAANFQETGFFGPSRNQGNVFAKRSPDPYEWKNPAEGFAVNLEYFLLDKEFVCRRPNLTRFFVKHFGHNPYPDTSCDTTNAVLVSGSSFAGTSARMVNLDFKRLYEVHYLYAGKGPQLMSTFGHAMMRLVFCSPNRKTKGPECRQDLKDHLVISYRGSVEDFSISYLDGLTGKYHSMLFLQPLVNVLDEYRRGELREVYSLPLKLSGEEMRALYDATLEAHWSYEGKYYFLANNCATETMNLLKTALDYTQHPAYHAGYVRRPDSLLTLLIKSGLADAKAFDDLKAAEENSLYFPQRRPFYEEHYARLQKAFPKALAKRSLDEFLDRTKATQRQELAKLIVLEKNKEGAAAMLILEGLVLQRKQRELFNEVLEAYMDRVKSGDSEAKLLEDDLNYIKDMMYLAASPARILSIPDYGIPSQAEVDQLTLDNEVRQKLEKAQALGPKVENELRKWADPHALEEFSTVKETRKKLREYLISTVKK